MSANIYSENWFRVSKLRVSLLDSVKIHKQYFKKTVWYLFEEVHNNSYFRTEENAYRFIKSLDSAKNLDENWKEYINKYPEISPNQDEVISILIQMHSNNLLYFKNKGQNEYIFDKLKKKKKKELLQKINSFLFIKIPIYNPNKLLNNIKFLSKFIFSKTSLILWIVVILLAINAVIQNHHNIFLQTQGMLAPYNLI